jgi:hypothetical protein
MSGALFSPVSADSTEETFTTENTTTANTTTVTTTKALTDSEYDYEGAFLPESWTYFHWVGDELDLSDTVLNLSILNPDGKTFDRDPFRLHARVNSGDYSDYYALDTSAVDNTTEGDYEVSVNTKGGNIITVTKDRTYRIKLIDYSTTFTVLFKAPTYDLGLYGDNYATNIYCMPEDTYDIHMTLNTEIESCVVADPSVAEIIGTYERDSMLYFKVKCLDYGETDITVTLPDGRTASCTFHVITEEELYPETTTTVIYEDYYTSCTTISETEQTTTTVFENDLTSVPESSTADMTEMHSDYTNPKHITSDQELCEWAEYDYKAKSGLTDVSAEITSKADGAYEITLKDTDGSVLDVYSIDPASGIGKNAAEETVDLPQTGNNVMTNRLIFVGALALIGIGLCMATVSGILRRKENEP